MPEPTTLRELGRIVQNWWARLSMTKDQRKKAVDFGDCEELLKQLAQSVDELRRETVADATRSTSWQPIETAPKDGTWIVVCSIHNKYLMCAIRWEVTLWTDDSDEAFDFAHATHWIPLPASPAPTEG